MAARLNAAQRAWADVITLLGRSREGDTSGARALLPTVLQEVDTLAPDPAGGEVAALALLGVGDADRTLSLLERIRPRGPWLWFALRWPEFDPIRAHARFRRLVDESRPPGKPR